MVYDLAANRLDVNMRHAHSNDVNSVVFTNREHSNIILSGSDDCFIKVWDRRALSSNRPAGIFVGHQEGVTHVCSKGDGIYFASNGKDSLLKLWDIRKLVQPDAFRDVRPLDRAEGFDYRWMAYPHQERKTKHPDDTSIMTFTGDEVLKTLIRCQFSPAETTGQRYLYSGSSDGSVYIFDTLTGEIAEKLVNNQTKGVVCRDISWHPKFPVLASTDFNGFINMWSVGVKEMQDRDRPRAR